MTNDNGGSGLLHAAFTVEPLAPWTLDAARRVIAGHARDAAEAAEVLDMLGLGGVA